MAKCTGKKHAEQKTFIFLVKIVSYINIMGKQIAKDEWERKNAYEEQNHNWLP